MADEAILIKNCSFNGSIKTSFNGAGLCGGNYSGHLLNIQNSYAIGSIDTTDSALTIGGLCIGLSHIEKSYFAGSLGSNSSISTNTLEVINYETNSEIEEYLTTLENNGEITSNEKSNIEQAVLLNQSYYAVDYPEKTFYKYIDFITAVEENLTSPLHNENDELDTVYEKILGKAESLKKAIITTTSQILVKNPISLPFFKSVTSQETTGYNCYYDKSLLNENIIYKLQNSWQIGKTTEEMTYPIDFETTYKDWIFNESNDSHWSVLESFNNGYPFLSVVATMLLNFHSISDINFDKIDTGINIDLKSKSLYEQDLDKWFPIVRTNTVSRIDDGAFASGTLINFGPYEKETWNGNVKGFFEYIPAAQDFESIATIDTMKQRLPIKRVEVTSVEITQDINPSDDEIFVSEIPNEWEISAAGEYKYLLISDGEKSEKIGYANTETREIEGSTVYVIGDIDRGIQNSEAKDFTVANGTVVYTSVLTKTLTWDDEITPLGKRTEYLFRAGIEVSTKLSTTDERVTFEFYGDERKLGIDESEPVSGLEMGELFIDARDLEVEDELFDRAKLKFEEMDLEDWNLEEFKQWTWNEFKGTNTPQFSTMALAELIKIAAGITDYTERDLVNNYSREEIEQIIQDKLDVVTANEINSWAFDVSKLVVRLLTGEPSGAYEDWTEREVKDFLISMLTDEFSYSDFEDKFPFDKWENIMKSRLEININNNASIEVEYNQYGPYNYMVDFQLGDIIVVEYPDVFRAMIRIIEVKEEYTQEGKKYTLTLGKEFETIVSQIKADKDDISGRL